MKKIQSFNIIFGYLYIYQLFIVTGLVEVFVNDDADPTLHVDCSQPLWVFVNLINSIAELNLSGKYEVYNYT